MMEQLDLISRSATRSWPWSSGTYRRASNDGRLQVEYQDLRDKLRDERNGHARRAQDSSNTEMDGIDARQVKRDILAGHSVWCRVFVDLNCCRDQRCVR